MTHITSRLEDMSPEGRLTLLRQQDGDIIVSIRGGSSHGRRPVEQSVEFCTGVGGGGSRRTLAALKNLMIAMAADNLENGHRTPDRLYDQEKIVSWSPARVYLPGEEDHE